MSHKQAGKLIIENIQMLEESIKLLQGELSEEIFSVIDKIIEEKVKQFEGNWIGIFSLLLGGLIFSLEDWQLQNRKLHANKKSKELSGANFLAYYDLHHQPISSESEDEQYWLSIFLNNPHEYATFEFQLVQSNFANCSVKDLKSFTNTQNHKYPDIEAFGFKYMPKEGKWVLRIESFNQGLLAQCYEEDNLIDAMEPIVTALETLYKAHPYFVKIVAEARNHFGLKEVE